MESTVYIVATSPFAEMESSFIALLLYSNGNTSNLAERSISEA
jgi:hypothetical protein